MSGERPLRPALRPPPLRPWVVLGLALVAVQATIAMGVFRGKVPSTRATAIRPWNAARLDAILEGIGSVPYQRRDWLRAMVFIESQMGRQAIAPLMDAASGDSSLVRRFALEALGMLQARQALPLALEAMDDPDAQVAASAAVALGDLGGPAAREALLAALDHPSDYVRSAGARSLALLELSEDDLRVLVAYADDPSDRVRDAVHYALATGLGLSVREPQRSTAEWRDWWEQHRHGMRDL